MKKQILLGSALLAAISAFPQNGRTLAPSTKMVDMASKVAAKYQVINSHGVEASPFHAPAQSTKSNTQARTTSVTPNPDTTTIWNAHTGSENIYGMLVSNSKPLQYNEDLGRVSFVHRKSHTYIASPLPAATASTGVIVADISNNWGRDWDSTALWTNDTYWARYPQGGIYNPQGNTDPTKAYVLGTGPTTSASNSWKGDWFASKPLDSVHGAAFTNTVGAMTFIANTLPFGAVAKVNFVRTDFSTTRDGKVRALGTIVNDPNNTTSNSGYGLRGCKIVEATFNATTNSFDWASGANDSIIWPAYINSTGNYKMMLGEPHMAWSEDGQYGYVFQIGCRGDSARPRNKGPQPMIFKTSDHGATWTRDSIDFYSNNMASVLNKIPGVSGTTLTIPFFNTTEDIDGIVDANGKLHIMATLLGCSKEDSDSLFYSYQFTNSLDNQTYSYAHTPGLRPFIFDFVGGMGSWNAVLVDSMSSEAPGSTVSTDNGFQYNPWDIDPTSNSKVAIDARMQMSRTVDGKHIIYTWAESDTTVTTSSVKWNVSPNIKARMMDVNTLAIHPTEINVTDPSDATPNTSVRGFAYNHYVSPKCVIANGVPTGSIAIYLPMTVSNNDFHQLEPVDHYYSSALLNFDAVPVASLTPPPAPDRIITGIAVNSLNSTKNSMIYPNPAKGDATLMIDMKDNSKVSVSVMNVVGQQVKATQASAQIGQNNISIDLTGLQQGMYMVNVKVGNATSTKKLIVE